MICSDSSLPLGQGYVLLDYTFLLVVGNHFCLLDKVAVLTYLARQVPTIRLRLVVDVGHAVRVPLVHHLAIGLSSIDHTDSLELIAPLGPRHGVAVQHTGLGLVKTD